jgi:hypothetical protein
MLFAVRKEATIFEGKRSICATKEPKERIQAGCKATPAVR